MVDRLYEGRGWHWGGYASMGQRWDMYELSLTDQAPRIVLQIEYNLIPSKKICRLVLPKMQGENKIHSFTIAIRFVSMSPHFDLSPSNSHGTTTVMRYACNTMSVARLPSCKHSLTNSHSHSTNRMETWERAKRDTSNPPTSIAQTQIDRAGSVSGCFYQPLALQFGVRISKTLLLSASLKAEMRKLFNLETSWGGRGKRR